MGRQYFQAGPVVDPPIANLGPYTSTGAELLWPSAYTPILLGEPRAGVIYCIRAGGIMSTGASGTMIIGPQYTTGTVTLGVSQTVTMPINMSAVAWYMTFDYVFRVITLGAASTMIGTGVFITAPFVSAPAAGISCVIPFGGTSASVDMTSASSISMWKTLSVAGSMTTQFVYQFTRN